MKEIPPTAGLPLQWRDLLPATQSLEHALSGWLSVPEVQLTCSGTAAEIIALTAMKEIAPQRHKVILSAYTCPLVALAVLHCGLQPVLCDTRPQHFDFDLDQLAALADDHTLAILPTHLGGRVANLAPILEIADKNRIYILEDAAQSLGATYQGAPLGMVGDAGFYSLAVGKGLTTFEGGVLLSRHPALRLKFQHTAARIAPFNAGWELRRTVELLAYGLLYTPQGLPLAYGKPLRRALHQGRLIEAVGDDFSDDIPLHTLGKWRNSIATNALKRLPAFMDRLNAQATTRVTQLSANGFNIVQDTPGNRGTWPFLMLCLASEAARDAALSRLWQQGLGVSRLYIHALPDYPYLKHRLPDTPIPNARRFAASMLTLSNSPWLNDQAFDEILKALQAIHTPM